MNGKKEECQACLEGIEYYDECILLIGDQVVNPQQEDVEWERALCHSCARKQGYYC